MRATTAMDAAAALPDSSANERRQEELERAEAELERLRAEIQARLAQFLPPSVASG